MISSGLLCFTKTDGDNRRVFHLTNRRGDVYGDVKPFEKVEDYSFIGGDENGLYITVFRQSENGGFRSELRKIELENPLNVITLIEY